MFLVFRYISKPNPGLYKMLPFNLCEEFLRSLVYMSFLWLLPLLLKYDELVLMLVATRKTVYIPRSL